MGRREAVGLGCVSAPLCFVPQTQSSASAAAVFPFQCEGRRQSLLTRPEPAAAPVAASWALGVVTWSLGSNTCFLPMLVSSADAFTIIFLAFVSK